MVTLSTASRRRDPSNQVPYWVNTILMYIIILEQFHLGDAIIKISSSWITYSNIINCSTLNTKKTPQVLAIYSYSYTKDKLSSK